MPDTTAQGTNSISLEAKVIRADGTEDELGVIAESARRFICDSASAWVEFTSDSLPTLPPAFLDRGETLTVRGPYVITVTEGTIRELKEEEE